MATSEPERLADASPVVAREEDGWVAPIPASSGKVVRYRLDRGGDRRLNRALHTIVLSLRRVDSQTKRYLARSLFRLLEAMPTA